MSKKRSTFSGRLGKAIADCGQTRYSIHKATGLSQSMLSRLVSGKGWIGRDAMNTLTDYLQLDISPRQAKRSK